MNRTGENVLIQEANHRIANNLAMLMSTVQLQAAGLAKGPLTLARESVNAILRDIAGKIASVGHLYRLLSRDPGTFEIDVGAFLIESCVSMIALLSLNERIGVVQKLSTQCRVKLDQAQPLGLIISEVMMNAVKYAHPSGIPVQMCIECRRGPDGGVVIEMGDDGVGLPDGFDVSKDGGTGFRLIRALAAKLDAKLDIESDSLGLSFRLFMPSTICAVEAPADIAIN